MTERGRADFVDEFIEDFHAECEQHLVSTRRVLLGLEGSNPRANASASLVHELLRNLHTLKGLCGMVGLSSGEQLAHALEDSLQASRAAGTPFSTALVDGLLSHVDLLERCIATKRTGAAAPDTSGALIALSQPSVTSEPACRLYHFEFVPSRELNERGIGVDLVRTRLRDLGELLDGTPRFTAAGIAFDFRVSVAAGRAPDEAWRLDGMTWTVTEADVVDEPIDSDPRAAVAVAAPVASASVVRVDLARIDAVMRLVGDLVVTRTRLDDVLRQQAAGDTSAAVGTLEEANDAMERQLRRLRDGVSRFRLVHVGEVFERLRFAVRDAARDAGKQVTLELHGQSTEIDKLVVDRMLEPLLHLVRNAVSHGIELPAARTASGKPAAGRLILRASASGDRILIQVEDDGGGIDVARVEARARASGLLAPDDTLADGDVLEMLCAPGFSTHENVDMTSGRGVGMDVVHATVRALSGKLSLHSVAGRGTRFDIELPLTLMIVDALLLDVGGQPMAVPQLGLSEIVMVDAAAIVRFENNDVISWRGGMLPLLNLARVFDFAVVPRAQYFVLVVGTDATPMGLLVDRVTGIREIVVHPVTDPLISVAGVSGATQLGDGRVSLILDAAAIVRNAQHQRQGTAHSRASARPVSSTPADDRIPADGVARQRQ